MRVERSGILFYRDFDPCSRGGSGQIEQSCRDTSIGEMGCDAGAHCPCSEDGDTADGAHEDPEYRRSHTILPGGLCHAPVFFGRRDENRQRPHGLSSGAYNFKGGKRC